MASESRKPNILSRVLSRFSKRKNKPAVGVHAPIQLEESSTAPSSSSRPPTHSVPNILLAAGNSIPQFHESQPPIPQFRSENAANFSQRAAMSTHPDGQYDPPRPAHSFPALRPYDNSPEVQGATPSFFPGASGFRIQDFHVNVTDKSIDGWELLLKHIAPNALHDSRVRYDAPRCDEDTRVEVTGEIMDWIQDRASPQRLLCMTGAAGAGKSALQQTIAERCTKLDILSATFFVSSADPTRNTISGIVPTISYQIGLKHDAFRSSVSAAVVHDPNIFSRSLQSQMDILIVRPFESLRRSNQHAINTFPYAILIDGLDECKGEPSVNTDPTHVDVDDRCRAEDQQAELLAALKLCILDADLPFRIFIASRPEWAIRTALEPGGHLHNMAYHIQLSDQYDASADMRRYLQRRFEAIGLRIGNLKWYNEGDIETLVQAASGQFIYVATVYKYISERRASPTERLNIVFTWTPRGGQATRPFDALDRLYTNILLGAKNAYQAVDSHQGRDFLLFLRAYHIPASRGFNLSSTFFMFNVQAGVISTLLGLETRARESLFSDLRSLVSFERGQLHLYHKSFSDFLEEESRSKDLFVPESRVVTHLAKCLMQHIIECPLDLNSLPFEWGKLPLPKPQRHSLGEAIKYLPLFLRKTTTLDDEVTGFTQNGGWQKTDDLLPLLYRSSGWFASTFRHWIDHLGQFATDLTARKPELAAIIRGFVTKWRAEQGGWSLSGGSDEDSDDSDLD